MEQREDANKSFIERLRKDYEYRTLVISIFSLSATAAFAFYNIFCAILYKSAWNIWIGFYYFLLVTVRCAILLWELRLCRSGRAEGKKSFVFYLILSLFLFMIDLVLVGPITMMVQQKKPVEYSTIPAITAAAYTVFRIAMASRNYVKTRKKYNLSVKMFRNISFIDALVSVLTLQYTLVITFGDGVAGEMLTVCAVSSFAIWAFLILISAGSVVQAVKLFSRSDTIK